MCFFFFVCQCSSVFTLICHGLVCNYDIFIGFLCCLWSVIVAFQGPEVIKLNSCSTQLRAHKNYNTDK